MTDLTSVLPGNTTAICYVDAQALAQQENGESIVQLLTRLDREHPQFDADEFAARFLFPVRVVIIPRATKPKESSPRDKDILLNNGLILSPVDPQKWKKTMEDMNHQHSVPLPESENYFFISPCPWTWETLCETVKLEPGESTEAHENSDVHFRNVDPGSTEGKVLLTQMGVDPDKASEVEVFTTVEPTGDHTQEGILVATAEAETTPETSEPEAAKKGGVFALFN